jgi:hypothetical protein
VFFEEAVPDLVRQGTFALLILFGLNWFLISKFDPYTGVISAIILLGCHNFLAPTLQMVASLFLYPRNLETAISELEFYLGVRGS